jgi:NNP family nitrate/nitrite transporter-like MFS transporter
MAAPRRSSDGSTSETVLTDARTVRRTRANRLAGAAGRIRSLWSFEGRYRVLHMTWFAFFLSFVVWFDYAPFAGTIEDELGLTSSQTLTLGLCNVALTVPARVFVGMALDRWGPRRVYAAILIGAAVPNTAFALSSSFEMLVVSRLALSVVGAGFVVGIRMVSEWFPPRELGTAEGIYGGWGNFGAAVAAFSLPLLAGVVGGATGGWRWAVAAVGIVSALYGLVYLRSVQDTPDGVRYERPRRQGALEVTHPAAVWGLAALTVPITAVLGLIAWRIWREDVISDAGFVVVLVGVGLLLVSRLRAVFTVNRPALADSYPPEDRYPFRTVAALCLAYFATFGTELAVVTILPDFFADTWGLGPAAAGAAASGFAFMNLVARPGGGLLSDLLGSRRRTLVALSLGLVAGSLLLSAMGSAWPWVLAIVACMTCSFFVQAGAGAVFAIVPLVKKRVSGQIAGLAGASGNVGAIVFLTVALLGSTQALFLAVALASVLAAVAGRWIVEPEHSFAAHLVADGASAGDGEVAEPARQATVPGDRPAVPPSGAVRTVRASDSPSEPVPALAGADGLADEGVKESVT